MLYVLKVGTPTAFASAAIRVWPGPIHWPPKSTGTPRTFLVQVRPPTRSRASRTYTEWPFARSARAVVEAREPRSHHHHVGRERAPAPAATVGLGGGRQAATPAPVAAAPSAPRRVIRLWDISPPGRRGGSRAKC